jgi:hypothetical protein
VDRLSEIKRLYYHVTPGTVKRDLARAIALLKEMETEDERERAAVFMDGLSQMRSEWATANRAAPPPPSGAVRPPAAATSRPRSKKR